MTTPLQTALSRMEKILRKLDRLHTELRTTRAGLDGLPGANATDIALERLGSVRAALDQAHHELEIEDGLYQTRGGNR